MAAKKKIKIKAKVKKVKKLKSKNTVRPGKAMKRPSAKKTKKR